MAATNAPLVRKKVGIFGLDNAGKTTIVEVIEDQKNLGFLAN
ncbi:MAG: hypothetical protein RBG13Loki_3984 [Promethearchaeota archaeon CR_4]|nr:MAG: hypothetical protein RBG13Loki_3984 [Candidatus Lokiarchaeota archaeon CR_4]